MIATKFEDLIVWNKSLELTTIVYKNFNNCRDFGFKDQITRSSVSIMNNIAEGFERYGDKEIKRYFFISKASCGELRSMLHLALRLEYISKESYHDLLSLSIEVSKIISGFIKSLKRTSYTL
jgi:four helix bundle protein